MRQAFYRYELWEDYQNGMYANCNDTGKPGRITAAVQLFRDIPKLKEEMRFVAFNWKIAASVNLSNPAANHQAWLGQASCCHYCGAGDLETIEAWHALTDGERDEANDTADEVFREWCAEYEREEPEYQYTIFDYGVTA